MEHTYENQIKCPYCDWEDRDSWEFTEDEGEQTCGKCEKEFNVTRNVDITYSTSRISCKEGAHRYKLESHFESKYEYTSPYRERIEKPSSEWRWFKIEVCEICEICDDKRFVDITQDEYNSAIELIHKKNHE